MEQLHSSLHRACWQIELFRQTHLESLSIYWLVGWLSEGAAAFAKDTEANTATVHHNCWLLLLLLLNPLEMIAER